MFHQNTTTGCPGTGIYCYCYCCCTVVFTLNYHSFCWFEVFLTTFNFDHRKDNLKQHSEKTSETCSDSSVNSLNSGKHQVKQCFCTCIFALHLCSACFFSPAFLLCIFFAPAFLLCIFFTPAFLLCIFFCMLLHFGTH